MTKEEAMQGIITLTDPAWNTTFPHIVTPREDEWLAGLLLRCDEANGWESGAALACLLDASYHSRLTTGFGRLKEEHLTRLARFLALPPDSIVATTYQAELARLSDDEGQHPQMSSARPLFHICPLCVAEDRMLSRLLCLPGISHCPRHRVWLVGRCQCGKPLLPCDRYALPFTCGYCRLAWEWLPVVQADREREGSDETLLSYYQFFLSADPPAVFASALRLIADRRGPPVRRHRPRPDAGTPSLEKLVGQLLELGLSLNDIRLAVDEKPDRPSKE